MEEGKGKNKEVINGKKAHNVVCRVKTEPDVVLTFLLLASAQLQQDFAVVTRCVSLRRERKISETSKGPVWGICVISLMRPN